MVLEQFEHDFFNNEKPVHLEFTLFSDQWEQLHKEIIENNWTNEEAIQYFLTAGLRAVKDLDEKEEALGDPGIEQTLIEQAQQERLQTESKYSVMRYRAYQFMQAVKTLEMQYKAALIRIQLLESLNSYSKQEDKKK
ncbi:MAG: hypothetical protein GYA12_03575 [Chloroflexi bacterium]|nr:hypothetical protein [Chloroflexota bacterium]BCY17258.1 hypothetical protein hrd7_11070 [Leptolinea sp. HRD-7]